MPEKRKKLWCSYLFFEKKDNQLCQKTFGHVCVCVCVNFFGCVKITVCFVKGQWMILIKKKFKQAENGSHSYLGKVR